MVVSDTDTHAASEVSSFEVEVEDNLRLHFTGLRIKVRHKGVSVVVFFLWRGSLIVYASMRLNSEPFFGVRIEARVVRFCRLKILKNKL
jgi:hypothetical protein